MSVEDLLIDMIRDSVPEKVTRLERIMLVVLRESLLKGGLPVGDYYDFVTNLVRFAVKVDDALRPPDPDFAEVTERQPTREQAQAEMTEKLAVALFSDRYPESLESPDLCKQYAKRLVAQMYQIQDTGSSPTPDPDPETESVPVFNSVRVEMSRPLFDRFLFDAFCECIDVDDSRLNSTRVIELLKGLERMVMRFKAHE